MNRKEFISMTTAAGLGTVLFPGYANAQGQPIPSYLKNYAALYKKDPRAAALQWFKEAKFGLFIHYGLYSIPGHGEWVQLREKIPVADYARLKDQFRADKFDADMITDMALEAGMKYINLTTRHHDSFCLWDTKYSDFKSTNSPAKRDLVGEMATQCRKKGLAFFMYYSHGRDWKHPHAPNNDEWKNSARPAYDPPDPAYKYGSEHHLELYVEFMNNQIKELLGNYGPVAGIWLDGRTVLLSRDNSVFHVQELYDMVHAAQPQVLVSYKNGLLGTEDFMAPERDWKGDKRKPLELCDTMQPGDWGYVKADDGKHKSADQVIQMLRTAAGYPANLLLNIGPLPSGAVHPEDVKAFKEVGKRIREQGWQKLLA
jgi:alpha-L-fucosidase